VSRRHPRWLLAATVLGGLASAGSSGPYLAAQESSSCVRAKTIVAEVEKLYAAPQPDHQRILGKLDTARSLCPSLGLAWKYSYCSAQALGQTAKMRIYQDRAVLNGVDDLSCAALGVALEPPKPLGPVRQKFALLVGIGTFADERVSRLDFPAKDARDLRDFLVSPQGGRFDRDNVFLLVDAEATRANILIAVQKIFALAEPDDLVVIYVSSHGSPHQEQAGLQGVGYIVTYDTNLDSIFVDALDFQDFSHSISLLRARRKVTFLDTCYSGQAFKKGGKALALGAFGISSNTAKTFVSSEGSYLITSSSDSEQSWESSELENSFFTYYLIEALRSEGDPPTLKQVFDSLANKVSTAVSREKQARQTPQMHPKDGPADLRIGVAPTEVRP
jgi:hypothetical protein